MILSFLPGILPGDLIPAKFQERLLQPGVQNRGESPGGGFLVTQSGMAPQFRPQSATLVSVYPNKESRVRNWGRAISHTMCPVFGETVVLGGRGQAAVSYRQPHRDIGSATGHVVPP